MKNLSSPLFSFCLLLFLTLFCFGAIAQTVEIGKTANPTNPSPGAVVTYTLNFRCASTTSNCDNVSITDVLPAGLVYVGVTTSLGGNPVFDNSTNTLNVTFNRGNGTGLTGGDAGQVIITCIVPSSTPPGTMFANSGTINSSNAGTSTSTASVTSTGGSVTGPTGISIKKSSSGNISAGGNASYNLIHGNTGGTTISNYVVEDCLPAGIYANVLDILGFVGSNNTVTVEYKTNLNSSYQPWTTFNSGTTTTINANTLSLAAGEGVSCIKLSYGDIAGNGSFLPSNSNGAIKINVKADNTVVDGAVLENCASNSGGGFAVKGCADIFVQAPSDKFFSYKSVPSGPFATGQSMDFYTGIVFPASNTNPVSGVVISDLLPAGFAYVAGSGTGSGNAWAAAGSPAPVETVIPNFASSGRTLVRWSWTTATGNNVTIPTSASDQVFGINLKAIPNTFGTGIKNCIYASVDSPTSFSLIDNPVVDTNDYDGDGNTTETLTSACTSFDVIGVTASAGLELFKLVKGQLDTDYSRYPATGITTASGGLDYRLVVKNPNSVPMTNIKIVDILPYIGDAGVIDLSPRNSQWQPNLAGPVSAPNGVTVYYSTEPNPCRDEMKQPSDPSPFPAGCATANWTTTAPANITTVRSLKFDFGSLVLNQNDQLELNWPMRAPVNAPANGEVAWNSFGFSSTRADNNQNLLPSEPIKVGIKLEPIRPAVIGDLVWIDTNQDGIKDANESGIDGVKVTLYRGDGSVAGFTITANGGLYLFPNLAPGDYYVVFSDLPAGYAASPLNQGGNPANDSDGIDNGGGTYKTVTTNLIATEDDRTWDFGIYLPTPCTNPTVGTPVATQATCKADGSVNNDAKIDISGISNATVYAFTTDGSTPAFANATSAGSSVSLSPINNPSGAVTYKFRFFNGSAACFTDVTVTLNPKTDCVVPPACTPPTPTGTGATVCEGATASISANGCDATYTLKWYSDAGLSNEITTGTNGNSLTTSTLTATTDYYAACVKDATCKSAGVKITATVAPKPTGTPAVTPATCNAAGTAANNNAKIEISNIANTTTYTVDGGSSQTINGGTITLDNLPNPIAAKNYVIRLFNSAAADCFTEITATLNPITCVPNCTNPTVGTPVATQATCKADGSVNNDAKIDISGISNATVYAFTTDGSTPAFANATSAGSSVSLSPINNPSGAVTYKFRFFNGSAACFTDVTVTLNPKTDCVVPPACTPPTPTGTGATVCEGATASISANGCDATYTLKWYSDAGLSNEITTGTNGNSLTTSTLTATTDYYAACVKDATCKSAGVKITATVAPKPTGTPAVTPATCNAAGTAANNNAKIEISNIANTTTYTVDGGSSQTINGGTITLDNLPNPIAAKNYVIRLFNSAAADCFTEITATLNPITCVPNCTNPTVGTPVATQATCKADGSVNNDAKIDISGISNATVYAFTTDGSTPAFANATSAGSSVSLSPINNPSGAVTYKFRFFNGSAACFTDVTVTLNPKTDCITPVGSIGDFVFEDTDNSNTQTTGDLPVKDVVVNLLNDMGVVIATTKTDADGKYLFSNLPLGTYSVQFVAPVGRTFITKDSGADDKDSDAGTDGKTGTYTLTAAEPNITTVDAGLQKPVVPVGSIGDTVFEDTDNSNTQTVGDLPVKDVVVNLLNDMGVVIATTKTDADGKYLFSNLPLGTYSVQFVAPVGRTFITKDSGADDKDSDAGTDGKTGNYTLTAAEPNITTVDAGLQKPVVPVGSIGDTVFEDTDNSNTQTTGDLPVKDVVVNLLNDMGVVIATTKTDADGKYLFSNLPLGTYSVQFVAPVGRTFIIKDSGADDKDSDAGTDGKTGTYTLTAAEPNITTVDAGLQKPVVPVGSIGDTVFEDTDNSNTQTTGDLPVKDVVVNLLNDMGVVIATTKTDADGKYLFSNLPLGTYSVQFVAPVGRTFITKDSGADDKDSDAGTDGKTGNYTLTAAEPNITTVDAGLQKPVVPVGSIGDTVFEDTDNSNTQTAGDLPVKDVVVNLLNDMGVVIATTKTDADGKYLFSNLPLGTYSVQFVAPVGRTFITKDSGADDKDSDAGTDGKTGTYTLTAAEPNITTVDAGLQKPVVPVGSIGDTVFEDTDNSNTQTTGDLPVKDVVVNLLNDMGVVIATTKTDADGKYLFSNLPLGTYSVQFVAPVGRTFITKDSGADDKDSDAGTDGKTGTYTLTAAEPNITTVDAGLQKPVVPVGSIGDTVFEDTDNSNTQTTGDLPVKDVVVNLLNDMGVVIATTKTDADGKYLFSNLPLGTYSVQFVAPVGRTFITKDSGADDKDSDAGTDGKTGTYTLTAAEPNITTVDAGLQKPVVPVGSIGDTVFEDTDNSNTQTTGDLPVKDVVVNLLNDMGVVIATTKTDADGKYLFSNLPLGTYSVQFVAPAGRTFITKDSGADDKDSDAGTDGKTGTYTLTAAEPNITTVDAGLQKPVVPVGSIGDTVFEDTDNSNTQTTGDLPVKDVVVNLLNDMGVVIATTKTDADGKYLFSNLPLGTYSVQFVAPANTTFVTPAQGGDPKKDSDAGTGGKSAPIALTVSTPNVTNVDAGLKPIENTTCITSPPTSVLGPNILSCIGKPYPELKASVTGTGTVDWFKKSLGGTAVAMGALTYTPAGNVTVSDTFYLATRSTLPSSANCPAVTERTRVIVVAQNCTDTVDLVLKKTVDMKVAKIGDVITYTIKVWNESNKNATGVEVTDQLPVGVKYESSTASRGSYSDVTGIWKVGNISANGDTVTLSIKAKIVGEGVTFNTAEIAKADQIDKDSTPGNGKDGEDDIDRVCVSVPLKLCLGQGVQATVPSNYTGVVWKDAAGVVVASSGNSVTLTKAGTYTFTASNGTCPAGGCCPVIVEEINCCPAEHCVPFTVTKKRK